MKQSIHNVRKVIKMKGTPQTQVHSGFVFEILVTIYNKYMLLYYILNILLYIIVNVGKSIIFIYLIYIM